MAYVPPALRKKQQEAEGAAPSSEKAPSGSGNGFRRERLPSAKDIHEHFWPPLPEGGEGLRASTVHSTLNCVPSAPGKLRYVMLFKDANPRWQTDHVIYIKTNLHMLPGSERFNAKPHDEKVKSEGTTAEKTGGEAAAERCANETPLSNSAAESSATAASDSTYAPALSEYELEPIAVFEQQFSRSGGFRFLGHHKISRLQFLEPRSADLVRMLEQKFSIPDKFGHVRRQQRDPAAWKASLEHRWAVIQLEKDEDAEKNLPAPDVKIVEYREPRFKKDKTPQKSVNELLQEMRLSKTEVEKQLESTPP